MCSRRLVAAAAAVILFYVSPAAASVLVRIDKSTQRMTVTVDGAPAYNWPVSTGRAGFGTPNGTFRPQRLARTWFSRKYYNSPMPHSIFYHGGYAIHGTNYIRRLGGPASHGCVRLHPGNAATLFALVSRHGMANTRIVVTGANSTQVASKRHARPRATARRPAADDYYSARPATYAPPPYYEPYEPRYYYGRGDLY
jgi:hypothetical protein